MNSNIKRQCAFSRFLKFWRDLHNLNQEELACRLDSSTRHISRLENGSSRPSELFIKKISNTLKLGNRDSNHLLMSAGYAPHIQKIDFNDISLKWLRKVMIMNLRALDPYPSALLDYSTNIVMVNKSWVSFNQSITSKQNKIQPNNFFDIFFNGSDSKDMLSSILMSIQQRALFSNSSFDYELLNKLLLHPNVPADWKVRAAKREPMASFKVKMKVKGKLEQFVNVSSMIGALGPAAFASEPQLTLYTLIPEDESLDLSFLLEEDIKHDLLFY